MESWKLKSRNEQNNTSQNMFHASLLLLEYNNGQRKEAEPSQQLNILQQVNRVCLRSDHLKPPKNVLFQEDTKYFMNICWAPNFEGHAVGNQSALTRPGLVSSKSLPNRGFQRNTMIQWCTVGTVHVPCLYNLYIYILYSVYHGKYLNTSDSYLNIAASSLDLASVQHQQYESSGEGRGNR